MKRFLILLSLLFCNAVWADTINLHWLNEDGSTYQNSTCEINSDLNIPNTPPTRYGYTFTGWKLYDYTRITYLESTGTQYIDTGIIGDETTEAEIQFYNYDLNGPLFMATSNMWSNKNFGITVEQVQKTQLFYMNCDGYTNVEKITEGNIKLLLTGMYLNGVSLSITRGRIPSSTNFTTTYPIFVFAGNFSGKPQYFSKYKLEYLKIWQNNSLVRDFIPVLDKDGVPCLFDKVGANFYYNQGTGQFIAGPVL